MPIKRASHLSYFLGYLCYIFTPTSRKPHQKADSVSGIRDRRLAGQNPATRGERQRLDLRRFDELVPPQFLKGAIAAQGSGHEFENIASVAKAVELGKGKLDGPLRIDASGF